MHMQPEAKDIHQLKTVWWRMVRQDGICMR